MQADPTFDLIEFQKQAPPAGGAPPKKDAPAGKDGAAPAKKAEGPNKELITEIAVKFVNAMWATLFAKVLSTGLQQVRRTATYYNAYKDSMTTAQQTATTGSVAYKSYLYSGYMLTGWGLFGWFAFLGKRFTSSPLMLKMALMAVKGNALVGLALLGLSGWKTASRAKCSADSTVWQCWYDSSPTDLQSWYNTGYAGQSRTSYLLAFQMMWLTKTTTKFLDADLKFNEKKEKKDEKKGKKDAKAAPGAPGGKDDAAPASSGSGAPASSDSAAPQQNQSSNQSGGATNQGSAAPKKEAQGPKQGFLEKVDGKNGRLVERDGDVEIIKDGQVVEINGEEVDRKETREEEKLLEEE